jgi:hypothetical protein
LDVHIGLIRDRDADCAIAAFHVAAAYVRAVRAAFRRFSIGPWLRSLSFGVKTAIVLGAISIGILAPAVLRAIALERERGTDVITLMPIPQERIGPGYPIMLRLRSPRFLHPDDASKIAVELPNQTLQNGWSARQRTRAKCAIILSGFDSAPVPHDALVLLPLSDAAQMLGALEDARSLCQWAIAPQRAGHHVGIVTTTLAASDKAGLEPVTYAGIVDVDVADAPFAPERIATYIGILSGVLSILLSLRRSNEAAT